MKFLQVNTLKMAIKVAPKVLKGVFATIFHIIDSFLHMDLPAKG